MKHYDFDTVVNRYGTYSTQWDYVKDRFGKSGLLPFTISDMDFKVPDGVSKVIIDAAKKGLFGYTRWNNPDLKSAITNWFGKRYNSKIDPNWIVYSPSVIFTLAKLLWQFSSKGDNVLTFSPCYDAFIKTVESNQRNLIEFDINKGIDWNKLEEVIQIQHPKIFLLCNPENPLGIVWSKEQIEKIVELCNAYHMNIISDEIHMDIARKGVVTTTLADYFSKLTVHSAVITSFTKAFNTPSLIFSYALLPDQLDKLEFLKVLKSENALSSCSYLGMLAIIDCYNNEENWLNQLNDYIDGNFVYTQKVLKKELKLDYKIPDATYLTWIDISPLNISMNELQKNLVNEQSVAIMDGRVYGNGGANHLRFNEGAPRKKIEDGLARLIKGIKLARLIKGIKEVQKG